MHDAMSQPGGAEPVPLLAPTEALRRGFEFDAPTQGPGAASPQVALADDAKRGTLLRQGFRVGDMGLMIRYEDGSELTDMPALYRLPNAPAWFLGMANLHGTLVSVFDPAELFSVAHDPDAKPMLLVLGHGDEKAGLVIDGLPQRLRLTAEHLLEESAVPAALEGCVTEGYRADGLDWMDFQYAALLDRLVAQLTR